MKALSLIEPWGSLIVLGAKRNETRPWGTEHRGPVLIHTSKRMPEYARERCWDDAFRRHLEHAQLVDYGDYSDLNTTSVERFAGLALGCIVGVVQLVRVAMTRDERRRLQSEGTEQAREELAFGDYSDGRRALLLADPLPRHAWLVGSAGRPRTASARAVAVGDRGGEGRCTMTVAKRPHPPSLIPRFMAPGSHQAIRAGCLCSAVRNCYGRGVGDQRAPHYEITQDCPLHDAAGSGDEVAHD